MLMAVELEWGALLVLLPESQTWVPLERPTGSILPQGLKNSRGWRMEVVEAARRATLYFPTAEWIGGGNADSDRLVVRDRAFGDGPALGGPVAWAGEVWVPVPGTKGVVNLVGKPWERPSRSYCRQAPPLRKMASKRRFSIPFT